MKNNLIPFREWVKKNIPKDDYPFHKWVKSRKKERFLLRCAMIYVLRAETELSLPQIGSIFEFNHATIHHSLKQSDIFLSSNLEYDRPFKEKVEELRIDLKRQSIVAGTSPLIPENEGWIFNKDAILIQFSW